MALIDNGILFVNCPCWCMQVDIAELVRTVNVRGYYEDAQGRMSRDIITRKSKARRILKYLLPYMDEGIIGRLTEEFRSNPDLSKIWEDLRK